MKPHYFNQEESDNDDMQLNMAKMQGYVPKTCLLGGMIVMGEVSNGSNPCWGCNGPREKCLGEARRV